MRAIPFLFLLACAHAPKPLPKLPEPRDVAPCLPGDRLARAKIENLVAPELVRMVDEEGNERVAFKIVASATSMQKFFDWVLSLETDREKARTGCVARETK